MTIPLSAVECNVSELDIDDIVAWITREAKRRLACDGCGPGGFRAKIYGVAMELDRMIGEEMKNAL